MVGGGGGRNLVDGEDSDDGGGGGGCNLGEDEEPESGAGGGWDLPDDEEPEFGGGGVNNGLGRGLGFGGLGAGGCCLRGPTVVPPHFDLLQSKGLAAFDEQTFADL